MSYFFKQSHRVAARSLRLIGEIILALGRFAWLTAAHAGIPDREARARWLQQVCHRGLRVFGVQLRVSGPIPAIGSSSEGAVSG